MLRKPNGFHPGVTKPPPGKYPEENYARGNFPSNLIIYGGFPTLAKILIVLHPVIYCLPGNASEKRVQVKFSISTESLGQDVMTESLSQVRSSSPPSAFPMFQKSYPGPIRCHPGHVVEFHDLTFSNQLSNHYYSWSLPVVAEVLWKLDGKWWNSWR